MKTWPTKPLSELSETVMGQAPPGNECNFDGNGTPFVKAGEFGKRHPLIREWTTKPLKFAKASDVLVCVVGATCGKLNLGADCAIGRSVAAIRPNSSVLNQRFLYAFLQGWTVRLRSGSQGSAQGVITREMLRNIPIPRPPLSEQERIVKLLDEADELRELRDQADLRTTALLPALFHEMFGDSVTNPKGWHLQPLGNLIECLDSQRVPITESDRTHGTVPYYGANGRVGWIDKHLFDEPLLLIAEDGGFFDQPERGVAYSITGKSWVNNHAHVLRPKKGAMELGFLEEHYKHFDFMPYVSGTTRAKLNKKQLLSIPTLTPPLPLQKEFAQKMTEIRELEAAQSSSRQRLDDLFQSMLHRAFNGDL